MTKWNRENHTLAWRSSCRRLLAACWHFKRRPVRNLWRAFMEVPGNALTRLYISGARDEIFWKHGRVDGGVMFISDGIEHRCAAFTFRTCMYVCLLISIICLQTENWMITLSALAGRIPAARLNYYCKFFAFSFLCDSLLLLFPFVKFTFEITFCVTFVSVDWLILWSTFFNEAGESRSNKLQLCHSLFQE